MKSLWKLFLVPRVFFLLISQISLGILDLFLDAKYLENRKNIRSATLSQRPNEFNTEITASIGFVIANLLFKISSFLINGYAVMELRDILIRNMQELFVKRRMYRFIIEKKIDNPDERITEETQVFLSNLVSCYNLLTIFPINVAYYTYLAYHKIGYHMPIIAFCIMAIFSIVQKFLAEYTAQARQSLIIVNGEFRYNHAMLRTRYKTISNLNLFRIEYRSLEVLLNRMLYKNQNYINKDAINEGFLTFIARIYFLIAIIALHVSISTKILTFSDDANIAAEVEYALDICLHQLGNLYHVYNGWGKWPALKIGYIRLKELFEAVDRADEKDALMKKNEDGTLDNVAIGLTHLKNIRNPDHLKLEDETLLKVRDLDVINPANGDVLIKIREGESIIIEGRNGCGKSSFFGMLEESFFYTRFLEREPAYYESIFWSEKKILFIPQTLYTFPSPWLDHFVDFIRQYTQNYAKDADICFNTNKEFLLELGLCTLRWSMKWEHTYAELFNKLNDKMGEERFSCTVDERIKAIRILKDIRLIKSNYPRPTDGFDSKDIEIPPSNDHTSCYRNDRLFTQGEMQCLLICAALLHEDLKLILMDEGTSQVDSVREDALMQYISDKKISMLNIGHRTSLKRFHTHVLRIDEVTSTMKKEKL